MFLLVRSPQIVQAKTDRTLRVLVVADNPTIFPVVEMKDTDELPRRYFRTYIGLRPRVTHFEEGSANDVHCSLGKPLGVTHKLPGYLFWVNSSRSGSMSTNWVMGFSSTYVKTGTH